MKLYIFNEQESLQSVRSVNYVWIAHLDVFHEILLIKLWFRKFKQVHWLQKPLWDSKHSQVLRLLKNAAKSDIILHLHE